MVTDQDGRLGVVHPALHRRRGPRVEAEAPGCVLLQDDDHLVDHGLLFGAVVQHLQLREELVVHRVLVVRRVLAVGHALGIRAVHQEEEVLGVGVIGVPAAPEHLVLAFAHLVLELVVVGGAHLELDVELGKLAHHPVDLGLAFGRGRRVVVVVDDQGLAALRVTPRRVAGLDHQLLGVLDRAPHGLAVHPPVRHRVDALGRAFARARNAVRQGAHRRLPALLREDARVLVPVDRDGDGLAQLAAALGLRRRVAVAQHGVEHVEANDETVHVGVLGKGEALLLVVGTDLVGVEFLDDVAGAGVGALEDLQVVVTIAELVALGRALALDRGHDGVNKGRLLAAVVKQAGHLVVGHALARVGLAAVVGVALHHDAAVFLERRDHVGAGADGPLVECHAALGHAGLGVEGIGLPGHRRHEGHLQPVLPLRVLALQADAQKMLLGRGGARQRPAPEVEKRPVQTGGVEALAQQRVFAFDQVAVVLQAQHVLGEDAVDGCRDARGGVAFEGVDEVLGHQLAGARVLEVHRRAALAQAAGRRLVVAVGALRVQRESWMRLEQDALPDRDLVDALGHQFAGRIVGQALAVLVEVERRDHFLGRLGHQLIGPLEVVVAVGRLIDLVGHQGVVGPIRRGRVEVARRVLDHGRVHRVL